MTILIKIKDSYRRIVSVCDKDLLGKYFEEGKRQLDIKKDFYNGEAEEKSKEEVIDILRNLAKDDATFNIVGKESIDAALNAGLIWKKGVMTVQGIPFALSLL